MQGGHQVAQKFRTSTFPPNETGVTAAPESALIVKSGAGSALFGRCIAQTVRDHSDKSRNEQNEQNTKC